MSVTSIWPYVFLMMAFILEGAVLSRVIRFHALQNQRELESHRVVALDGLRGILALSVFFLHAVEYYHYENSGLWLPPNSKFYSQLGIFPVTMFFFITGYVFWRKLIQTPRIPFGRFLYGRLGRLGGIYCLVCILCFALTAFVSGFHRNLSLPVLTAQVVGWLLFFGSGHDINGVYFSRLWLGPGWTLRYEWLFYFSLPLLGWFARRWQRLPLLLAAAAVISYLADHLRLRGPVELAWGLFGSYAQFLVYIFSVGMVIAAIRMPARVIAFAQSRLATCLSLLVIAATIAWATPECGWRESLLLAAPFACLCMGNTWFGLLTWEPIRFLGRISYSFYLLHVVLLAAEIMVLKHFVDIGTIGPIRYWIFAWASGAMTIGLSAITYQYLEYPLLHVGRSAKRSDRHIVPQRITESYASSAEPVVCAEG